MRRINVFLFLSVIVFSFLMYGCGDSDSGGGGGGGGTPIGTIGGFNPQTMTGADLPASGNIKIYHNNNLKSTASYSNSALPDITLTTPNNLTTLPSIMTSASTLTIDPALQYAYLSLEIANASLNTLGDLYPCTNAQCDAIYEVIYVDRDVTINGYYIDGDSDRISYDNIQLSTGWNMMKFSKVSAGHYRYQTVYTSDSLVWVYDKD